MDALYRRFKRHSLTEPLLDAAITLPDPCRFFKPVAIVSFLTTPTPPLLRVTPCTLGVEEGSLCLDPA